MDLANKVAVVTGATGGIGAEIVREFVEQGAKVLVVDLDQAQADTLAASYGSAAAGFACDVTDYAQVEAMLDAAVDNFGTLDVVINNAGVGLPKLLLEHNPAEDWELVTSVNQKGVYHGLVAAGKKFVDLGKPGVILNASSVYGQMAAEMTFVYNVSKAAVDMMTKCAALEFAPHNIRVVAVAPGRVDTPMLRQYEALGLWDHIRHEQMRAAFTQPVEIANVYAFLASDRANCINGTTVSADDGFTSFKYPLLD
ncbi:SDR family oxidoreductase [Seongchinamella unica]|uniref:SDR family oxidoreductase n=1 Tax=Seongchinamella unica TaxID=2547392 RepID=A0A4R5LVT8_9GAMM|nr:SDR family oxidoreductase [Seongchinamella unica]TDG15358.1 SDR family oxidoreductase [Seongchinamella unica]